MATWPATLPSLNNFLSDGYSETPPDNVIRTDMDLGPAKLRQRGSAAPDIIEGKLRMTGAELAAFRTFYETTLFYGSIAFDATHPRTGASVSMRFVGVPQIAASGVTWIVSMTLEVLP